MKRERILHWASHHALMDWMRLGWIIDKPNGVMHHHEYSFLVEFLCDCKEPPTPHEEEWRDVPGYEGFYQASTLGRVRSLDRIIVRPTAGRGYPRPLKGVVLKAALVGAGYESVALSTNDGEIKRRYVAHIVAETFLGPRPQGMQVCHNDGSRTNNRLKNLRYGTPKENSADKFRHGTMRKGESAYQSKLTEDQVHEIRRAATTTEDYKSIGKRFGITHRGVSDIVNRLSWKHLPILPGEVGSEEGDIQWAQSLASRRSKWATELNKSRAGRVGQ